MRPQLVAASTRAPQTRDLVGDRKQRVRGPSDNLPSISLPMILRPEGRRALKAQQLDGIRRALPTIQQIRQFEIDAVLFKVYRVPPRARSSLSEAAARASSVLKSSSPCRPRERPLLKTGRKTRTSLAIFAASVPPNLNIACH